VPTVIVTVDVFGTCFVIFVLRIVFKNKSRVKQIRGHFAFEACKIIGPLP